MARKIQDVKELFINFLLENDCYSQFIVNLLEQKNESFEEFISTILFIDSSVKPEEELINWAFGWVRTEQGYDFWSLLDAKWRRTVRQ